MKRIIMILLIGTLLVHGAFYADETPRVKTTILNQDPDPAEPGEYLELRWKVTKYGSEAIDNLTFVLEPEYPFFFDASDNPKKSVGYWTGYSEEEEHYTLYYKIRVAEDALEGTYTLDLKHQKRDGGGWATQEYEVRVGEKEQPDLILGAIRSDPKQLKRDLEEVELSMDLSNIGESDADNVKIRLELPEGITPSYTNSHEVVLGTIGAGTKNQAQFYLDIAEKLEAGAYPVDVTVNYKEENEYKQITLPLNLTLKPSPYFEITNTRLVPKTVRANTQVDIHLTITNTGSDDAESVSLHAYKDSSQPFEFDQKSDYIGNLKGGETGEAVITLDVEEAKPKTYLLDLEVRAVDSNEVLTQERQISFEVANGPDEGQSPIIGFAIIAGIVLVGSAIYYWRKRQ
ncbi:MAG: COG1361 S-layer family protein [Nanobdellota archaeon]